jgi:acetoin utilization deacetylase AcuC-like enzyme
MTSGYPYAAEAVIGPALEAFAPERVLVASGIDPDVMDALARRLVTTRGSSTLTATVTDAADRSAHGRLVLVQEGGYSLAPVPHQEALVDQVAEFVADVHHA